MGIEVRRWVFVDEEDRVKGETESNVEIAILMNSALMLIHLIVGNSKDMIFF